jgi:hypothetical protein
MKKPLNAGEHSEASDGVDCVNNIVKALRIDCRVLHVLSLAYAGITNGANVAFTSA